MVIEPIKFLWLSKNIPNIEVHQKADGVSIAYIRKNVTITHNGYKNNKCFITFTYDNAMFIIPDTKTLEEIYKIHMQNEENEYILRQYCENNLTKC